MCPRPDRSSAGITVWRVAYREWAEDLLSIAKPRQRGCPPCSGQFMLGRPHNASTPRQGARPQGLEGVEGDNQLVCQYNDSSRNA